MDIDRLEGFALGLGPGAGDGETIGIAGRERALAAFVPGTAEHDRLRVLLLQQRGQVEDLRQADAILDRARTRHGSDDVWAALRRRQLVLWADADLAAHGRALADATGVSLAHPRQIEHETAAHPSALDPALIEAGATLTRALAQHRLPGVAAAGLPMLLSRKLTPAMRRELLGRLTAGGHPGLVEAVALDLEEAGSRGFGSLEVHRTLVIDELEALASRLPRLRVDPEWVHARLARERPPAHVDLDDDLAARVAHLDRLWVAVRDLPGVFVPLKVHVAYHRLDADLLADQVDRDRLATYLALPRQTGGYTRSGWLDKVDRAHVATLHEDYRAITGLPPVGNDAELVQRQIARILTDDPQADAAPWLEPLVDAGWLRRLTAEVRLLTGAPDPEHWGAVLGPAGATAVRDRVDIEILPHNPRRIGRGDAVALDVGLKNCWPLSIRVFRINDAAHFASRGGEVPLDLDLDGLSAAHESTLDRRLPPMVRVRERIALPACDRPGTYVVELVGNGRASRALVRKGGLRWAARPVASGLELRMWTDLGEVPSEPRVWLGGRAYGPGEDGAIRLPFGAGSANALVCDADVAMPAVIALPSERYAMRAALAIDRQALVPGVEATCLARVQVTVSGVPVPIGVLEDAYAEITTTDRVGVVAKRRRPLTLRDDGETSLSIAVPEHLAELTVAIGGAVQVGSEHRRETLRDEQHLSVGTIHQGTVTEQILAWRTADGWRLRLVGKNGEPRPGRAVTVALRQTLAVHPLEVLLATDAVGEIALGALVGVDEVRVTTPGGVDQRVNTGPGEVGLPGRVVVVDGAALTLPLPVGPDQGVPSATDWAIVELRGGLPSYDRRDRATVAPGLLSVTGLAAGRYQLRLGERTVDVVVLPGPERDGWAMSPTETEAVSPPRTLLASVESAAGQGAGLTVSVANPSEDTRVHVIGTPLWPEPAWSADLDGPVRAGVTIHHRPARTAYVNQRDIGDEVRYVLDRKRYLRRPGTMADRPALLLNPWALRATHTATVHAKGGGGWGGASAAAPAPAQAARERGRASSGRAVQADPAFATHDFLAHPALIVADLRPDADGVVRVPQEALAHAAHATVVCVDPSGSSSRTVPLPWAAPLTTRDRRVAAALPADRHLREVRRLEPAPSGHVLRLTSRATVRIELADTVDKLYRALCALSGDAELAAWDWLPRWPTLPRAERLRLYGQHACHELAVFVRFRDPALFDDVLRPYVANKLHKTFVDRWLLGDDLGAWLEPWRLDRLDAIELALLATARPDARGALVRRLRDAVDLIRPNPQLDDQLVNVLLAGGEASGPGAADPFGAPPPPPAPASAPAGMVGFAADALSLAEESADDEAPAPPQKAKRRAGGPGGGARDRREAELAARADLTPLYRSVDRTMEWAEHNWWHRRPSDPGVEPARLWRDLAGHDLGGPAPFLSPHLADAASGFAASVVALAVVGVPFEAERASFAVSSDGKGGAIEVRTPTLAAVADLAEAEGPPSGEVLVGQSTFRMGDRYEWDGAEQREKYATGELAIGVVYESEVVVSNPTGRTQRLDVLVQIPAGAIAVGGGIPVRTTRLELAPYATSTVTVGFTFPEPGVFEQYGARVTAGDRVVAAAPSRTFTVARAPSTADPGSWAYVSQRGTLDEVIAYLGRENLGRVELEWLAWRLADPTAFARITAALAERRVYDDVVWGYALLHADRARASEWLAHQESLVAELGPLHTPGGLAAIDPIATGAYEHLEYAPLVNARAHRLGERPTVANDGLSAQWTAFLLRVAAAAKITADDWLEAAHYLFAMERGDEARQALAQADPRAVSAPLQHAYATAFGEASGGDPRAARVTVGPYVDHPVPRWRSRFAGLAAVLDEAGFGSGGATVSSGVPDPEDRDARVAAHAQRAPALSIQVTRGSDRGPAVVRIDHRNLARASVRVYRMDVELLFSRQPFLGAGGDRFTLIDPTERIEVALTDGGGPVDVPLPASLAQANVVIEVVAEALRSVATHFANDLAVTVTAAYGQLQVCRASTGQALPAAYVKAYGRTHAGEVVFHKDGYTDLRGRFDYATVSTDALDQVQRFALLVIHDDAGTTVSEADPPQR